MAWVEAARLADMEEGKGLKICHDGHVVAVFIAEGTVYAVADRCTHAEASLSEGEIFDTEVECPLHGAVFDLTTGVALTLPATRPVATYPTRVEEGRVLVSIPDNGTEETR